MKMLLYEKLILLFKECITVFEPFWGGISNSLNIRRYDGYWGDILPTTIHWVNYFGNQVSEALGEAKILSSPTYFKEKYNSGYFVLLKEEPINDESEEDLDLQQKANIHFGL